MDGWRTDTEVSLQVSFSRRPAEDVRICVDERQILTLLLRETWGSRRRHRYIVYAIVICGKHLVRHPVIDTILQLRSGCQHT